jgi:NosR/NirI family transcriptional regulator, nitrous oxide reductase regulator
LTWEKVRRTILTTKNTGISKVILRRRRERIFAVISLVVIAVAWIIGGVRAASDILPAVEQAMPAAGFVEKVDVGLYATYGAEGDSDPLGYVAIAAANGYGGPLTLAVAVGPTGTVLGMVVADHKETPSWLKRVMEAKFMKTLMDKPYTDPFQLDQDVDGVTGATYTSRAMAEAALKGSRVVASHLGLPVEQSTPPKIIFGIPEIVLIALYAAGYLSQQKKFQYKKQLRWGTLLVGMIVLGFIYNKPLTLSMFNQALLGYFPQWQTNLYWFLLIGGILFVFTVDNKNPYCEFFCPFGAAQECMGVIGGAKNRTPGRKAREFWKWVHRSLLWVAVIIALVFRNPGISSYEIFGTLFKLVGNNLQFILLGLVLIVSLFVKRPWCNYLCPLHPVEEFIRVMRRWIKELWQNRKTKASA